MFLNHRITICSQNISHFSQIFLWHLNQLCFLPSSIKLAGIVIDLLYRKFSFLHFLPHYYFGLLGSMISFILETIKPISSHICANQTHLLPLKLLATFPFSPVLFLYPNEHLRIIFNYLLLPFLSDLLNPTSKSYSQICSFLPTLFAFTLIQTKTAYNWTYQQCPE